MKFIIISNKMLNWPACAPGYPIWRQARDAAWLVSWSAHTWPHWPITSLYTSRRPSPFTEPSAICMAPATAANRMSAFTFSSCYCSWLLCCYAIIAGAVFKIIFIIMFISSRGISSSSSNIRTNNDFIVVIIVITMIIVIKIPASS